MVINVSCFFVKYFENNKKSDVELELKKFFKKDFCSSSALCK